MSDSRGVDADATPVGWRACVCVVLVVASTSASPKSDGEPVVVLVV